MQTVSEGTYQGTDGTTYAYKVLSALRQRSHPNFARAVFGYKRTTESEYTLVPGTLQSGLEWRCKIEGLIPGATYDFITYAENAHGVLSDTSNPTLQAAAADDTTAPGEPTGASVTSPTLINAIVSWTNPSDADLRENVVYRNTSAGFPGEPGILHSERGGPGDVETWADTNVSSGTTYYYWLRAFDYSGNYSDAVYAGSVTIGDSIPDLNHGFSAPTELTISGGEITVSGAENFRYHTVDTEADAASDDLDKINGGNVGELLLLQPANAARTVVVRDGADIPLENDSDFSMEEAVTKILLICTATDVWEEVMRSKPDPAGFGTSTELTISSGEITVSGAAPFRYHTVDTEGNAATDDLDKVNGGNPGDLLILRAEHSARTVVVKDDDVNLYLQADFTMDYGADMLTLICYATDIWLELSRAHTG